MADVQVRTGQTLTDIAIQYLGTAQALPDLALANGLLPNAEVDPGTYLVLPPVQNKAVVDYYQRGKYYPSTRGGLVAAFEGISYWEIGTQFTVQ